MKHYEFAFTGEVLDKHQFVKTNTSAYHSRDFAKPNQQGLNIVADLKSSHHQPHQHQQQQPQQHQHPHPLDSKPSSASSGSSSAERPVYLGHTSLLSPTGTASSSAVPGLPTTVKTEPRSSCDAGVLGQSYSAYYQHPHQLGAGPAAAEHQQANYYAAAQEAPYHHQHHVTAAAKLLASS